MNPGRLSTTVRLAAGLTLLTVSLLLVGSALGLIPDRERLRLESRAKLAEMLAVAVTLEVSEGNADAANVLIEMFRERNAEVRSVLLRRIGGESSDVVGTSVGDGGGSMIGSSSKDHLVVPINRGAARWGALEVDFEPSGGIRRVLDGGSPYLIVLYLGISGFIAYWLFLKRTLTELDPSEVVPDRVGAVLDTLSEGLVMLDRSGRIVLGNEAFGTKTGRPVSALVGYSLSRLPWELDRKVGDGDALPWDTLLESGGRQAACQVRYRGPGDGALCFAVNVASITGPDGQVRGAVVTFDDVTEMQHKNADLERALERLGSSQREIRRQNDELRVLAMSDPLTGALNRRSLFEGIDALFTEPSEHDRPIGCIMIDLDHFKSINDDFGHATGDEVIRLQARVLREVAPVGALIGRYGGEEFCVVVPDSDESRTAGVAERMRLRLHEESATLGLGERRISASLGVSCDTDRSHTASTLIDLADKALYVAKESGRDRVARHSLVEASHEIVAPPESVPLRIVKDVSPASGATDPVPGPRERGAVSDACADTARAVTTAPVAVSPGVPGGPVPAVFADRLVQAIERSRRFDTQLAVLFIEFPTVDLVRNTAGDGTSDKLLEIAGQRLNGALRSTDTVSSSPTAEWGFAISRVAVGHYTVLLTDLDDKERIPWIVHRLFAALESSVELEGRELVIDARIGASIYPLDGTDAPTLIATAGTALHEALASKGRNTCSYFSDDMNVRSEKFLFLQSQLHHALERGELFVVYQPLVDMRVGKVSSLEALIRWRHPELGMVSPEVFIPIAEHTGLIDEIGDWVVRTACAQLKAWHDRGFDHLCVAVNLAAPQLCRPDLTARISSMIEMAGIDPKTLILELTESALIENIDVAVSVVQGLSRIGARVALDDFGTGYSSLSYLRRFPIDIVKIDRSFFTDFPDNEHGMAIVSAIISLVHSLGLSVVAEGVETGSQLAFLQSLDVDVVQGYHFSAPLTHVQVGALLENPEDIRRKFRAAGPVRGAESAARPAIIEGVLSEAPRRAA